MPHLVIEGDNFDALRMLRATHRGQVRVIYIDPPYNTGNKDWVYNDHYVGANDRYRHSQCLEFLYQRLCLARDLLTSDGVVLVSINDENRSRLELLMEEVMPGRRVGSVVWKKRKSSNTALDFHFSSDHEHILVYANAGFEFNGSKKTWDGYQNWDEGKQNWWSSGPLTLGFTKDQRPNLFYPLQNPATGIWYPCDPKRVWVYASRERLGDRKVRTQPMENMIEDNLINFPTEITPAYFQTEQEILHAIQANSAPPYLSEVSDLSFWIGKKIAFGRPRFKRFKDTLVNESMPLSSWCVDLADSTSQDEIDIVQMFVGRTSEGTMLMRDLGMAESFNYAKPLSLIKNLLQQATRPNDIVLDFFAGSGTTGQAVLELNAEDEGNRRFILCSSTEATTKEPNKNLCRDVCAERMRRVMQGYGNKPGLGDSFAYLQLDKFQEADVQFEVTPVHAAQLLSLQANHGVLAGVAADGSNYKSLGVIPIASDGQLAIVLVPDPNEVALNALLSWPGERLVIYSTRPQTVAQYFSDAGREVISRSLHEALLRGQTSGRKS